MKIILIYPELEKDTEEVIIDWLQDWIDDKSGTFINPLKHCEAMEVER